MDLRFDNRFLRELPGDPEEGGRQRQVTGAAWSRVRPTAVRQPSLGAVSSEVMGLLGLDAAEARKPRFSQVFSGNELLPGMDPFAACYGGHQFGSWAGQLGDGRAISLGEVVGAHGRLELQLKGAGQTPYSRHADGRAVLRSSLREFLCSEAMFHLGVPTTRALSLVLTGERVERDMFYDGNPGFEPGAIVCRVAPSFLRFGSFELPSLRGDKALLAQLVDFCIARDFPEIEGAPSVRRAHWFERVCVLTARMVAHWMRVGFVHGVMNTDNMSVLGLTIDYGPYGWLEDYDPGWTPNTTDAATRRYRYGAQPEVAAYNLSKLAQAISPLFESSAQLVAGLQCFEDLYRYESQRHFAQKLGFSTDEPGDPELSDELLNWLRLAEVDMTIFFRSLADLDLGRPDLAPMEQAFYRPALRSEHGPALLDWLGRYAARIEREGPEAQQSRRSRMLAVNPRFVLRNYLAQEAIDLATTGDFSRIEELLAVLRHPYDEQPDCAAFAQPRPEWARSRPGCSMLSCSS